MIEVEKSSSGIWWRTGYSGEDMILAQNQLWQQGEKLFRIVQLERLSVEYKELDMKDPEIGTHHQVSKKEFCRLIKGATEVQAGSGPNFL